MPFYDYRAKNTENSCEYCRVSFEVMHGMTETGPEVCPKCGTPVTQLIHAPQVKSDRWSTKRLLDKDNLQKHGFETGTTALEKGLIKLD